jgi:hypothetical protein
MSRQDSHSAIDIVFVPRSHEDGGGPRTNCRPSAFQAFYHPESTYLEKTPTAQLTRIDAAERLFSVPLTRITSVPECAVSSVGFLWGSATVSQACGASVGLAEALICPAFPIHGARVPRLPEVTQRHRSGLPAGVGSAPEDRITDRYHCCGSRGDASPRSSRCSSQAPNSQGLFQLVVVGVAPPCSQLPAEGDGFLDRGERVLPPA